MTSPVDGLWTETNIVSLAGDSLRPPMRFAIAGAIVLPAGADRGARTGSIVKEADVVMTGGRHSVWGCGMFCANRHGLWSEHLTRTRPEFVQLFSASHHQTGGERDTGPLFDDKGGLLASPRRVPRNWSGLDHTLAHRGEGW